MCRSCLGSLDIYDDIWGGGFGRGGYDPWDDGFSSGGRGYLNAVSDRAYKALDNAKNIFLKHLAIVDTSQGAVTEEIIRFHLVPDVRKQFNKFVREYNCVPTSRQLTREEQDLVNKTRKSLMYYTSVKVTPQAQASYVAKNAEKVKEVRDAQAAYEARVHGSTSAGTSASAASASTSTTSAQKKSPLKDASLIKTAAKLNQAAVAHAANNSTLKAMKNKKKA